MFGIMMNKNEVHRDLWLQDMRHKYHSDSQMKTMDNEVHGGKIKDSEDHIESPQV